MPRNPHEFSNTMAHVLFSPSVARGQQFRPAKTAGETISNPRKAVKRGEAGKDPLVGSFVLGLLSHERFGKVRKIKPGDVRAFLMEHFPAGGTIVLQLGWYGNASEDSVRVSIENHGMPDGKFQKAFKKLVEEVSDRYDQMEVWYDFFRGSQRVGQPMSMKWSE